MKAGRQHTAMVLASAAALAILGTYCGLGNLPPISYPPAPGGTVPEPGLDAPATTLESRLPIRALAFSADGRWFAAGSEGGQIVVYNVATWQPVRLSSPVHARALAFNATSSSLLVGGDGGVQLWSTAPWKPQWIQTGATVTGVAFANNQAHCVAATSAGTLRVHDCASGEVTNTLPAHPKLTVGVGAFADGTVVSVGPNSVVAWDVGKGTRIDEENLPNAAAAIAMTNHGSRLVAVGKLTLTAFDGPQLRRAYDAPFDESARHLWSSKTTARRHATAIACGDDGRCAIADAGGIVDLYDTNTQAFISILFAHSHSIAAIAVDPASKYIVTAGIDRVLRVWKFPPPK